MIKRFTLVLMILFRLAVLGNSPIKDEEGIKPFVNQKPLWGDKLAVEVKEILTIGTDDLDKEDYYFSAIGELATDVLGNIYVQDYKNCWVKKFSGNGVYIRTFGRKGQGPGEFFHPRGIAVDTSQNLYVVDQNMRVTIFNPDGSIKKIIPTKMFGIIAVKDYGKFYMNASRDVGDYRLYQYDAESGKIEKKFCWSGEIEKKWVAKAGEIGSFSLGPDGNVYFTFFYPYDIKVFSPDGLLINRFNRKAPFLKFPAFDKIGVIDIPSGSLNIMVLPDGKVINVVREMKNENESIFHFDVFDKKGIWLTTFTSKLFNNNWVRYVTMDGQGNIILDYSDPFPVVKKFSLRIDQNISQSR